MTILEVRELNIKPKNLVKVSLTNQVVKKGYIDGPFSGHPEALQEFRKCDYLYLYLYSNPSGNPDVIILADIASIEIIN